MSRNPLDPINPEVLPPEARNMYGTFNKPVKFNMGNTLQSPLFWMLVGGAAMWGLHYYFTNTHRGGKKGE